jgi:hypothetical protein
MEEHVRPRISARNSEGQKTPEGAWLEPEAVRQADRTMLPAHLPGADRCEAVAHHSERDRTSDSPDFSPQAIDGQVKQKRAWKASPKEDDMTAGVYAMEQANCMGWLIHCYAIGDHAGMRRAFEATVRLAEREARG